MIRPQVLVGGRGFEPRASRSRTVSVTCPRVSRRVRRCPPELKVPRLGVRACPPRSAWCRESVPRLCPGECLKRRGAANHLVLGNGIAGVSVDTVQCVDPVGRGGLEAPTSAVRGRERCAPRSLSNVVLRASDRRIPPGGCFAPRFGPTLRVDGLDLACVWLARCLSMPRSTGRSAR